MDQNPFPSTDADRHEIWDMLVRRDIEAFVANDWPAHEADFLKDVFFGINAGKSDNPDSWNTSFPDLASYAENWKGFSSACHRRLSVEMSKAAHFDATTLRDIDIKGDFATAHKKFDGRIDYTDGSHDILNWQTLYFCRKHAGRWWIAVFVGFLPNPMGTRHAVPDAVSKIAPASQQHSTAGPYSPVLEVRPGRIVVISGQAPLDMEGQVPSQEFKEQTRITLENCRTQLQAAGCGFADVFKVNAYLTDLANWPAFNDVYRDVMPEPRPVRTAVQAGLLESFQIEIEMWAAKP